MTTSRKRDIKDRNKDKVEWNEDATYESHEIGCETEMTDQVWTHVNTSSESH